MKRLSIILFCGLIAQTLFAQQQIEIQGTWFNITLNDDDNTAAIRDNKYKLDDAKYPMYDQRRKFANLGNETVRTVIIPSKYSDEENGKEYTITTIGRCAFAGFSNVDQIVIPSTITSIEDYAFFRSSVSSIVIPTSVTQIGNRVFGYCPKLRSLTLPLGMQVGNDLYSESKKITVKYELDPELAGAVAQRKTIGEPSAYASTSDVDVDIPTLSPGTNSETFAVIIANENYKKVAKVACAQNDGRAMRRYCENVLGIPGENIHYVEDATLGAMTTELNWATRVAKAYEGDARIIIYYAGHGIPNEKDGAGFLLPVDVAGNDVQAAYSLDALYKQLGALNAKSVTLFMDACFSGARRGDGMLVSARSVAIKAKTEQPLGNMVVFSAAQGDETAYPYAEKGHGLFTYFLLKKLKETKGDIDYGTLSEYIRKEVTRKSAVVNNKPQTPSVSFSPQMSDSWNGLKLR
ncbi:MAG: caspase family protein [Bacteroidaceae bacterium]|nr:caspase family protein [Bacteroidaceae bacterium]